MAALFLRTSVLTLRTSPPCSLCSAMHCAVCMKLEGNFTDDAQETVCQAGIDAEYPQGSCLFIQVLSVATRMETCEMFSVGLARNVVGTTRN